MFHPLRHRVEKCRCKDVSCKLCACGLAISSLNNKFLLYQVVLVKFWVCAGLSYGVETMSITDRSQSNYEGVCSPVDYIKLG